MFRIETSDPAELKRIVAAGTGGLLVGLVLLGFNLVVPVVTGIGVTTTNVVFALFGAVVVVLATHPTYQAANKLDNQ